MSRRFESEAVQFLPPDDRPPLKLEARSVGAAAAENPARKLEAAVLEVARERKLNFSAAVDVIRQEAPEVYAAGIAHYGRREPKVRLTSTERQRRDLLAEVNKRVATGKAANFSVALEQIKREGDALYAAVSNDYAAPSGDEE